MSTLVAKREVSGYTEPVIAQATGTLLEGAIEVPFPIVAGIVGVLILAGLVYFARRIS